MSRTAALFLLALAMLNIAYGDLLRPCACSPDNPYSCGLCPGSDDEAMGSDGQDGPSSAPC